MVQTINPAVCGARRDWVSSLLLFFAGSFVGGAVVFGLSAQVSNSTVDQIERDSDQYADWPSDECCPPQRERQIDHEMKPVVRREPRSVSHIHDCPYNSHDCQGRHCRDAGNGGA